MVVDHDLDLMAVKIPSLNCRGRETNNFAMTKDLESQNFSIFGVRFHCLFDECVMDKVAQQARMAILELKTGKCPTNLASKKREEITSFLYFFRDNFESLDGDSCGRILGYIGTIIEDQLLLPGRHMIVSSDLCSYNFSHGFLEWRFIYLTILLKLEKLIICQPRFEACLSLLIHDLLLLARKAYENVSIRFISFLVILTIILFLGGKIRGDKENPLRLSLFADCVETLD